MKIVAITFILLVSSLASAQQTILNIPSADVLDKSNIYFRLDTSYFSALDSASVAPNFIFGFGHNIEGGVNTTSFGIPADFSDRAIVPNIKWKFRSGNAAAPNHMDLYVGNQVFVPTFHRTFDAGNYLYAASAWTIHSRIRFTAGAWDSQNVVANGNRVGPLLGLEWTVAYKQKRTLVTLGADWQSGRGSNGALSTGVMVFPASRLMIIPAFQVANSGDHTANGVQLFIGYLLKK